LLNNKNQKIKKMDTTPVIIAISAATIIMVVIIRMYINKKKEMPMHGENLYKDDPLIYSEPESCPDHEEAGYENDIFEEQEEEPVIPDEQIEKFIDEPEKELARVNNYLITNEIKKLSNVEFFHIQERILLYEFVDTVNDFTVDHIYQIAENRYIAVIGLPDEKSEGQDQERFEVKQILGIIECRHSLGNGRLKPYEYKEETTVGHGLFSENQTRFGNYTLIPAGWVDLEGIEKLCKEFDNRNAGYFAFIEGKTVYLRINRHVTLTDLKTMIEILVNYQY
jgi:hypothetical protein